MKRYLLEKKNISKMIIVIIALASVLSISITCFIVREVIARHDEELIKVIASDVVDDIGNELLKAVMISRGMANDTFLHQSLRAENDYTVEEYTQIMTDWLSSVKDRLNYSSAFLASNNSKNYWQATGLVKRLDIDNDPHDVWYQDIYNKNTDYVLNVDTDEAANYTLGVFVNHKIRDSNKRLLGVCGVGISMRNLQKMLELDEKAYKIKITLVNRFGVVQVDTESGNIEHLKLDSVELKRQTDRIVLNQINDTYVVTKYIPELDWYLVIQRHGDNMQSAFSNVILYMSIGFFAALAGLLIFVQLSLNKGRRDIEESAKKHGIASHAGLYVSMHLLDLKNDLIHELSKDPNVQLFLVDDGRDARLQLKNAVKEMTDKESLPAMLEFINFDTLTERMKDKHAIHQEFLSEQYGWCKAYFMVVDHNKEGGLNQIVFAIELIDEEKRREKHLLYLSETDAMTGLRNRGSGERIIADLIERGTEGMFCLLDADKFKSINDTYGHDVGDAVIKAIADCLKKSFRNDDIVMRLGGDEFAAYAIGITDEAHGRIVAERLFDLIDKIDIPALGDRKITISLGAALFKVNENCSFADIYKRADTVAYVSKKTVGNCCTFYEP